MTRRRSALAMTFCGLAGVVGALAPVGSSASAASAPGEGFGQFAMSANAKAVQFRFQEPSYCFATDAGQNGCEAVVPEAVSTLRSGPFGKAVAAVVWPGALAADLGNLLITASDGQIPAQARMLNDPVRATSETNTDHETASYDSVPGSSMKSEAKSDHASAAASVENGQVTPAGTVGKATGTSSVTLTGAAMEVAKAHSEASDISLAGGVIHIGAVVSDVVATSDGVTAKVAGKTTASGITIAGVPVTVDGTGITVASQTLDSAAATAAVNTAVSALGIKMVMGSGGGKPTGSAVTYTSGSLVIMFKPPVPAQVPAATVTVTLGGANVSVDADPALDLSLPPVTPPVGGGGTGAVTTPPVSSGGGGPVTAPITSDPGAVPTLPDGTAPTVTGPTTPVIGENASAASPIKLPGGTSPWLGVLGVLGSGLIMAGLRRLPDNVLLARSAVCPLEERP